MLTGGLENIVFLKLSINDKFDVTVANVNLLGRLLELIFIDDVEPPILNESSPLFKFAAEVVSKATVTNALFAYVSLVTIASLAAATSCESERVSSAARRSALPSSCK